MTVCRQRSSGRRSGSGKVGRVLDLPGESGSSHHGSGSRFVLPRALLSSFKEEARDSRGELRLKAVTAEELERRRGDGGGGVEGGEEREGLQRIAGTTTVQSKLTRIRSL